MPISLPRVTLVAIFVECILYGVFLVLFLISSTILLRGKKRVNVNKPVFAVSCLMLMFATVHVGTDLQRVLDAFLNPDRPAAKYLPNVNDPLYLLKCVSNDLQTITGDSFLIYRVYLVWQRNKLVVFPLILSLLGTVVAAVGTLHAFTQVTPNTPVFIVDLQHWIISFFVITLVTNLTSTLLIASRIWWINRATRGRLASSRSLAAPMILIIESGAIYSFNLIVVIILYAVGSFAQYIAFDAVTQTIGIVFSMIIVRIGLGLSSEQTTKGSNVTPTPINLGSGYTNTQNSSFSGTLNPSSAAVTRFLPRMSRGMYDQSRSHEFPMRDLPSPVEVKVTAVHTSDALNSGRDRVPMDRRQNDQGFYQVYKDVEDGSITTSKELSEGTV